MRVIFRVDASLEIGTGHVMRCLTLADALSARGADCEFICREHPGNLVGFIRDKGYPVHELPVMPQRAVSKEDGVGSDGSQLAHSRWLGASQTADARACAPILAERHPDWLVVDHYSLDARWERALTGSYGQLMVIDDLADRPHACDILLDQTLDRTPEDYQAWVTPDCLLLCGSKYALLRPEFAALRPYSLQRRVLPKLCHLLVTLGGVDKENLTQRVLEALRTCALPDECLITVVLGTAAPWRESVRNQAESMPWPTRMLCGVSNMAQLMAESDLAIGGAGATAWERCCLGLPTAMIVLAENQAYAAKKLERAQAVRIVRSGQELRDSLTLVISEIVDTPPLMKQLGDAAALVTDGGGCNRVAESVLGGIGNDG